MKKTKIILPILLGLAVAGTVTTTVLVNQNNKESAETSAFSSGEVKDPYTDNIFYVNEKITIGPKDIIYDGHLVTCYDFYMIYPDKAQKSGLEHRLSQTGEYTIVYIGKDGNQIVKASENIYAYNKAYEVGKESSSCKYVDKIVGNQTETPGISVSLSEGDTWTFNQAIDISKADLTKPIITYYTRQMSELHEHMSCDVDSVVVRITDYYNPEIYVDVYNTYNCTNNSTGRLQPYVLAGANGQAMTGIDPANRSSRTVNYNGMTYYLHSGKAWGACLDTVPGTKGIYGKIYSPDIANSDNRGYSLYYNYAQSSVYMHHRDMHIVTDLDEPGIYSNNLFGGFTTGEVIVSMRCDTYNEAIAEFEISEIFGLSGEDLNRKYSYDENAPIITLSNNANNFKIARGEEFSVFSAIAKDPNLVGAVTTEVYYDYGTENQRYIPLVDGKFIPNYIGEYTIRYSAKDLYGNEAEKLVSCDCINAESGKIVSVNFEAPTEVEAGSYLTINIPEVKGYNDGLYAEALLVYTEGEGDVEEIDLENPTILVKRVGEYEIDILYGDVANTRIAKYKFTSKPSENCYLETPHFAKYYIKGSANSLENSRAVLCNSKELNFVKYDVYVNEDGLGYKEIPIDPNNFVVNGSTSIQFKYVCNNKVIYESDVIEVVDVNFIDGIDMTKYFAGNMNIEAKQDSLKFTGLATNEINEADFINPLSFNLLRLDVEFDAKGISKFKYFDIVLSDYYGVEEDFVMSFSYTASSLSVKLNGVSSEIGPTNSIILSYDTVNNVIGFGNGLFLDMTSPFPNDKFYLSFKVRGVTEDFNFAIKSINNQNLNFDTSDFFAPQISYNRLKGQRRINDVILISKSYACDVLSPYLVGLHQMLVTLKGADGTTSIVSSVDGVLLDGNEDVNRDYQVRLDKFGTYTITYKYSDQAYSFGEASPNKLTVSEVVYVNDNEAPVITIDGVSPTTIELANYNEEVTIHNYKVEDQSEVTMSIYAFSPMGGIVDIINNKFKANYVGDWKIVYFAVDANGNVSSASYTVRVK